MYFGHLLGSPYFNIAGDVEQKLRISGRQKRGAKGGEKVMSGGMRGAGPSLLLRLIRQTKAKSNTALRPQGARHIGARRAGATARPQGGNLHAKRAVQI